MSILTPEQNNLFMNYYKLTIAQKNTIIHMKKTCGQTVEEIARKFTITQADVKRIVTPPKNELKGYWTREDRERQWLAGQKRSVTVGEQNKIKREEKISQLQNNYR